MACVKFRKDDMTPSIFVEKQTAIDCALHLSDLMQARMLFAVASYNSIL